MIRSHVAAEGWRCCGCQEQTRRLISRDANEQRGSASQGDKTAKTLAPQSAGNRRIVLSPRPSTTSLPTQPRFMYFASASLENFNLDLKFDIDRRTALSLETNLLPLANNLRKTIFHNNIRYQSLTTSIVRSLTNMPLAVTEHSGALAPDASLNIAATHPFTCNTCQVAFRNSDAQRTHMRSDWQYVSHPLTFDNPTNIH